LVTGDDDEPTGKMDQILDVARQLRGESKRSTPRRCSWTMNACATVPVHLAPGWRALARDTTNARRRCPISRSSGPTANESALTA